MDLRGFEWHVSERATNAPQEEDEDLLYEIHYMLDPGDGLCSTLIRDLPKEVADHIIELHNRWLSPEDRSGGEE
jgi:hypothetical protein